MPSFEHIRAILGHAGLLGALAILSLICLAIALVAGSTAVKLLVWLSVILSLGAGIKEIFRSNTRDTIDPADSDLVPAPTPTDQSALLAIVAMTIEKLSDASERYTYSDPEIARSLLGDALAAAKSASLIELAREIRGKIDTFDEPLAR